MCSARARREEGEPILVDIHRMKSSSIHYSYSLLSLNAPVFLNDVFHFFPSESVGEKRVEENEQ